MKRVLITGSREWTDRAAIACALNAFRNAHLHEEIVVVHGGARGADTIADEWARAMAHDGVRVEVHPVTREDWKRHGKRAGYRRNAAMVKSGADICLAFPLGKSNGTRGCMGLAKAAGIPVVSAEPTCA